MSVLISEDEDLDQALALSEENWPTVDASVYFVSIILNMILSWS